MLKSWGGIVAHETSFRTWTLWTAKVKIQTLPFKIDFGEYGLRLVFDCDLEF